MQSVIGAIIIFIGFASALAYIPLQIAALVYTRGVARQISLVPIPFAVLVSIVTISGLLQQSNLWPIYMIFTSPFAIAILVGCLIAEFSLRRRDPNRAETLRQRRRRMGLCEECGYDLQGKLEAGCPECGWGRNN